MDPSERPLWQCEAPPPDGCATGPPPSRTDVAIVGAGYTGLTAARVLARGGARVVVLEARELGGGASSRNGGMALMGLKQDASVVARRFGVERARALWEASRRGIRAIERLSREEAIDCDFERSGSLYLASKPAHYDEMRRESEWLARHFDYERIDLPAHRLGGEIGSTAFHGASLDRESAGLHPAKLVQGLAAAAKRAGAQLFPHTPVRAIEPGREHTLSLPGGTLRAREVLVATNGYTDRALAGLARRVVPIGSSVIATAPLPAPLRRGLSPKARMFYDSKWYLAYFRLTPSGRMLFGGRTTLSPRQHLHRAARTLRRQMVSLFPELRDVPLTHCWSGQLGFTFDALPHIGRLRGAYYTLGYGGHGVALANQLGVEVAELIAGKRNQSLFQEIPHPTRFFYRGRAWFRPVLAARLRFLDWIS